MGETEGSRSDKEVVDGEDNSQEIGPSYCRYCGAVGFTFKTYEATESSGSIAFNGQIAGTGGGITLGNRNHVTTSYRTKECNTCRKIWSQTEDKPEEASFRTSTRRGRFILPHNFKEGLLSLQVTKQQLQIVLDDLLRWVEIDIIKFVRTGGNPCKHGKHGFKHNIIINSNDIGVRLLIEIVNGEFLIRIVYGGVRSVCP